MRQKVKSIEQWGLLHLLVHGPFVRTATWSPWVGVADYRNSVLSPTLMLSVYGIALSLALVLTDSCCKLYLPTTDTELSRTYRQLRATQDGNCHRGWLTISLTQSGMNIVGVIAGEIIVASPSTNLVPKGHWREVADSYDAFNTKNKSMSTQEKAMCFPQDFWLYAVISLKEMAWLGLWKYYCCLCWSVWNNFPGTVSTLAAGTKASTEGQA